MNSPLVSTTTPSPNGWNWPAARKCSCITVSMWGRCRGGGIVSLWWIVLFRSRMRGSKRKHAFGRVGIAGLYYRGLLLLLLAVPFFTSNQWRETHYEAADQYLLLWGGVLTVSVLV